MNKFASVVRSPIRNVVLCSVFTLTLAACGGGSGSSSGDSIASDPTPSLVSQTAGMIDRSATDGDATAAAATTPASATNAASSGTSVASTGTNETTVATIEKVSTNPTPSPANPTSAPPSTTSPPATASTGNATLDWTPPTENSDGSSLRNLAGYTVYYGTSPSNLTQSVRISNPGLTAYTMTNLASGTWYFAVTAVSATGDESSRSGVVHTTI